MAKKEESEKKNLFFTVEVFGMAIALFCILALVCLLSGSGIFGNIGLAVQRFLLGVFGYTSFPVVIFFAYIGVKMLIGFKLNAPNFKKFCLYLTLYALFIGLIFQTITTDPGSEGYGAYLVSCYKAGLSLKDTTAGGMLLGLINYPLEKFTGSVGAYIIYGAFIAVITLTLFRKQIAAGIENNGKNRNLKKGKQVKKENKEEESVDASVLASSPSFETNDEVNHEEGVSRPGKRVIFGGGEFEMCSSKDKKRGEEPHRLKVLFGDNGGSFTTKESSASSSTAIFETPSYRDSYDAGIDGKTQFVRRPYESRGINPVTSPMNGMESPQVDFTREAPRSMGINIENPDSQTYVVNEGGRERSGISSFENRRREGYSRDGYSAETNSGQNSFENTRNIDNPFDRMDRSRRGEQDGRNIFTDRTEPVENNGFGSENVRGESDFSGRGRSDSYNFDRTGRRDNGRFGSSTDENQESFTRKPFTPFSGEGTRAGESPFERENSRDNNLSFGRTDKNSDDNGSLSSRNLFTERRTYSERENESSSDVRPVNPIAQAESERGSRAESENNFSTYSNSEDDNSDVTMSRAGSYFAAEEKKKPAKPSRDYSHQPDFDEENIKKERVYTPKQTSVTSSYSTEESSSAPTEKSVGKQIKMSDIPEENQLINPIDTMPRNYKYNYPPSNLLNDYRPDRGAQEKTINEQEFRKATIINILKNNGIDAKIEDVRYGPAITRFEISIPQKVPLKRVLERQGDLNLWLSAKDKIRIVAPIIGTSRIGIEVPNSTLTIVGLRGLIEDPEFKKIKKTSMTFCFGRDIIGSPIYQNIAKMPHLLVAGATGTGKSVFLNTLLISLMYKYSPEELRIILVDPKIVEFTLYKGTPNLMFDEIFTKIDKTRAMLEWAVEEMDNRYEKMEEVNVRELDEYNEVMVEKKGRKMPKILIIIDEFADIMNNTEDEYSNDIKTIGKLIEKLSSKARSAGIHLILATQRPSANIVEGSIKTNFISRIAFKMATTTDACVIMDEPGAEKLLGSGDVMYRTGKMSASERAQACFIDRDEIIKVCNYVKENNKCYFNEFAQRRIEERLEENVTASATIVDDSAEPPAKNDDELLKKAMRIAITTQTISISGLQRKMGIGFPKAGKIVDTLVEMGYITNLVDNKHRKILMTKEQFEDAFGEPL